MTTFRPGLAIAVCTIVVNSLGAEDWRRFRGPDGRGVRLESEAPLKWSDTEKLKWKAPLPGPGSSSPIVVGKRVFVTCYSGEGDALKRHIVCVNRADGEPVWSKSIDAVQPEDGYRGYITEHGYASNTPVTDGERLYVFLGKSGVIAFDLDGNEAWRVSVGTESSNRRWGSAASLVLYKDTVIVNASEESQSIQALDKATGKQIWNAEAGSLELAYGTPTLVELEDGRPRLLIGVPSELWALNPDNGKLAWYAETNLTGNICPQRRGGRQRRLCVRRLPLVGKPRLPDGRQRGCHGNPRSVVQP